MARTEETLPAAWNARRQTPKEGGNIATNIIVIEARTASNFT